MQAISTPSSFALAGGSCLGRNRKYAARRGTKPGAAPRAAFRAPVAGPRDDAGAPVGAHRARPHRQPRSGNGPDDANAADAVLRAVAQTRASTRAALAACRAAFDAASSSSSTTRRDVDERSATPSASAAPEAQPSEAPAVVEPSEPPPAARAGPREHDAAGRIQRCSRQRSERKKKQAEEAAAVRARVQKHTRRVALSVFAPAERAAAATAELVQHEIVAGPTAGIEVASARIVMAGVTARGAVKASGLLAVHSHR